LYAGCAGEQTGEDQAPSGESEMDAAAPTGSTCEPGNGGLVLPAGFCAVVVADELGRARHLAVADNGDVYVRMRNDSLGGGIVALRDTTGDGRADVIERFRSDGGTGIEIRDGMLWFSTDTTIFRVPLPTDGTLVPTAEPELVVSGFPAQRSHSSKPFTFDGQGGLYVTVGSPTNACQPQDNDRRLGPGQDPCPEFEQQAGIWRFDANRTAQTQQADGRAFAVGIRNAMAIAWNDAANALYVVQHGRDVLNVTGPETYTLEQNATKPGELMYRLEQGDTMHHPYCFWDLDQQLAVLAPEYGGDGQRTDRCASFEEPLAAYPAHWGPNDIVFYDDDRFPEHYRGGAFIAFHGSWNRAPLPMEGYLVAFQPMNGGDPAGEYEVFADGFKGAPEISSPGEADRRPTGLAIGPDGSLYVSDSLRGRIWRILPAGE
jgi:glucose/arabinose dehydrogenase